jgi:hypothetical protein
MMPPAPLDNYRVTINPDADFAAGQVVKLLIDAKDKAGNPMDQKAVWFRTAEAPPASGSNYRVMLEPLADLSNDQIVKLQVDAKDIDAKPMDRQTVWFRTIESSLLPGKNYRVFIDALHDLLNDQLVKLLVSAKDINGNPMDQENTWFRTIPIPLPEGKNYRISIDPLHDLSQNQVVKLQVNARDDENNPMDTALVWFKTEAFYPGYRIFINPSIDFEELQTVNLEIAATNLDLLSLLETFWFQTEHFEVVVNILAGYPDIALIGKQPGFDTAIIKWETNKKVGAYQVEVGGSGKGTGVIIGTVYGSQNVQGNLPGVLEAIETIIKGADLEAASPDSGEKRINIYVTDGLGNTNPYEG